MSESEMQAELERLGCAVIPILTSTIVNQASLFCI
jgi:hypothetical protein